MITANLPRPEADSDACIILGMGPQALFLLREYRQYFRKIYMMGQKNWIGYLSRHGHKIVAGEEEYKNQITEILEKWGEDTPILLSGGSALYFYLQHKWIQILNCYPRPLNSLTILNDKTKLYRYAEENGIPVNRIPTYNFHESPPCDFPIILKWATDIEIKPFKTIILKNKKEYRNAWETWYSYTYALVVQPYIREKRSIAWAAYCSEGEPVKEVVVRQVRQYPSGLTNYVVPLNGNEKSYLQNIGTGISRDLSYTGFIELEFLQDIDTGTVYLLEANPRPWGWIDYMKFSDGGDTDTKSMVNIVRDLYYLLKYDRKRFRGNIPRKALRYLRHEKAVWDWRDPMPIFGQMLNIRK